MTNQLLNDHIKAIHNGLKMSNEAVSNYLENWFDHLPVKGKEDVMCDSSAPEMPENISKDSEFFDKLQSHYEYELDNYKYELGEWEDMQWHKFSEASVEMKLEDFREYAHKYADQMLNNFKF